MFRKPIGSGIIWTKSNQDQWRHMTAIGLSEFIVPTWTILKKVIHIWVTYLVFFLTTKWEYNETIKCKKALLSGNDVRAPSSLY